MRPFRAVNAEAAGNAGTATSRTLPMLNIKMEIEKYGALKITQSGNEILYKDLEFLKREKDIISPSKKKITKEKTQLEQNLYEDLESKTIFDELKN